MNNIEISPESIVYIQCPANFATGGPELLHQLAKKLRSLGVNAQMYYLPNDIEDPVHPRYLHYQIPFSRSIENSAKNLIILPETYPSAIYEECFSNLRKIIWWLSVDNYFTVLKAIEEAYNHKKLYLIKQFITNYYSVPSIKYIAKDKSLIHFAQSYYAVDFLEKNNVKNVHYLSDYLGKDFLNGKPLNDNIRENIVLYNPKKGLEFTKKIIEKSPDIKWIALENLNPSEVSELLAKSKVYIDFGNHPGKDRFPREAAIMGCCVITGKKGSAAFHKDLPIDEEFKFGHQDADIIDIIEKIRFCFSNFEEESKKFNSYKTFILNEEKAFIADLKKIFVVLGQNGATKNQL